MARDDQAVDVPVGRSTRPVPGERAQPPADRRAAGDAPELLTPLIDIYEGPEGLVLEADMPGVAEQDLVIELEENVLNLRGRVTAHLPPDARPIHAEYRPGEFGRSFILTDDLDRARISASLKNGVLRISLPRTDRARTRKIEIKTS